MCAGGSFFEQREKTCSGDSLTIILFDGNTLRRILFDGEL